MIKEITFHGYTAQPSDYECADGELAMSLNLISEDGAIKPVARPASLFKIPNGYKVTLIHNVAGQNYYILDYDHDKRHFFCWVEESVLARDGENADLNQIFEISQTLVSACSLGNVLVFAMEESMHYAIWREGEYIYLGERPPFVPIEFELTWVPEAKASVSATVSQVQGRLVQKFNHDTGEYETEKVTTVAGTEGAGRLVDKWQAIIQSDEDVAKFNEPVYAAANLQVAEIHKLGYFCMPFLVRYALRLFDGSYISHSAPVLMFLPGMTDSNVECTVSRVYSSERKLDLLLKVAFQAAKLRWKILPGKWREMHTPWESIVESLDIFVSAPLYSYDQAGKFGFLTSHFRSENSDESSVVVDINNGEWSCIPLPKLEQPLADRITSVSAFYEVASLPWSELIGNDEYIGKDVYNDVVLRERDLRALATFPVLGDDFRSRSKRIISALFPYNNRLSVANSITVPSPPVPFRTMAHHIRSPFATEYETVTDDRGRPVLRPSWSSMAKDCIIEIKVYCEISGVGCITSFDNDIDGFSGNTLSSGCTVWLDKKNVPYIQWPAFLFYPDPAAKYMLVSVKYTDADEVHSAERWFKLKSHDYLNGAYWIHPDIEKIMSESNPVFKMEEENPSEKVRGCRLIGVSEPYKVLSSSVNNPFFFPVEGITSVGTGRILGLSSAAKALSQGQFGQFPLYAFTSDGVWAMEVSATGTYSARQPITRDVCVNPGSITQIDSAVLFTTDRGIMLISGSQTQCISDVINSEYPFDVFSLSGMDRLHAQLDCDAACLRVVPFSEFLGGCNMIYDYVHQHIIIYNALYSYAYVWSLESQRWGMMLSDIRNRIGSYPEALAMDNDNNVINFTKEATTENGMPLLLPGLLVTRPLKFDNANIHKTVDAIIQRGNFAKGSVKSVLYGSRDLINWHIVWSSKDHYLRGFRGTPYKYFRIALLCDFAPGANIYGSSVQFTPRLTNQPR